MGLSDPKTLPARLQDPACPFSPPLWASAALSPILPIHHSQETAFSSQNYYFPPSFLTVLCPFSFTEQSGIGDAWLHVSSPPRLWSRVCGGRISDWQRACRSENRMSTGPPPNRSAPFQSQCTSWVIPQADLGQQLLNLRFPFVKWCK